MSYNYGPYVNRATKQKNANREATKLKKKGVKVSPVKIEGRTIAKSFWGKAWCDDLERNGPDANRLAKARTYARNGSIVHLELSKNKVRAIVAGSSIYQVEIVFNELEQAKWLAFQNKCKGQVSSLVDLLAGKIPESVMKLVSEEGQGLFPGTGKMKFSCTCPDFTSLCKHVAAVLYGVGSRLDSDPELIFRLRGVDPRDLLPEIKSLTKSSNQKAISNEELEDIFGVDIV